MLQQSFLFFAFIIQDFSVHFSHFLMYKKSYYLQLMFYSCICIDIWNFPHILPRYWRRVHQNIDKIHCYFGLAINYLSLTKDMK